MHNPHPADQDDASFFSWSKFTSQQYLVLVISILLLLFVLYLLIHYFRTPKPIEKGFPIVLAEVQAKRVPIYINALGNVTATYTVTVKTQINGLLMNVLYKEGQLVKKGDLLAQIDERPLLAQLQQYAGQLQRDQALLANALIDLKRYQQLWKQDSVSQQTLATQEALVRQYQGNVQTDEGLLQVTKVNLMYCKITAPIDGRVGLRLVDPGNFVQTSDAAGLVVITSVNPITVIFTVPEDDISQIVPQVFNKTAIPVEAFDRQQTKRLATGTLLTIDNLVDTTTGTVKLRAQFNNEAHKLFPNQFVNVKLLVKTLNHAMVVPTAAIQHYPKGDFVYLLNQDQTVKTASIKVGVTSGDDTVIMSGLALKQKVVVSGADKLKNGAKVFVVNQPIAPEQS